MLKKIYKLAIAQKEASQKILRDFYKNKKGLSDKKLEHYQEQKKQNKAIITHFLNELSLMKRGSISHIVTKNKYGAPFNSKIRFFAYILIKDKSIKEDKLLNNPEDWLRIEKINFLRIEKDWWKNESKKIILGNDEKEFEIDSSLIDIGEFLDIERKRDEIIASLKENKFNEESSKLKKLHEKISEDKKSLEDEIELLKANLEKEILLLKEKFKEKNASILSKIDTQLEITQNEFNKKYKILKDIK